MACICSGGGLYSANNFFRSRLRSMPEAFAYAMGRRRQPPASGAACSRTARPAGGDLRSPERCAARPRVQTPSGVFTKMKKKTKSFLIRSEIGNNRPLGRGTYLTRSSRGLLQRQDVACLDSRQGKPLPPRRDTHLGRGLARGSPLSPTSFKLLTLEPTNTDHGLY